MSDTFSNESCCADMGAPVCLWISPILVYARYAWAEKLGKIPSDNYKRFKHWPRFVSWIRSVSGELFCNKT